MPKLFDPLKIRSVTLKNRIAVSPMCQYSSQDGFANDWHLVHIGSRAVGGAGLIIQEATAVSPEARITPDDLGIWKDQHIEFLTRISSFVHQQNCAFGIQLAHAGRKASHTSPWKGGKPIQITDGGWETIAPSAIAFSENDAPPLPLAIMQIEKLIDDFAQATRRSLEVGYEVLEIHAAHGYLIHEFLSPLSNRRNDEYGGAFENRIRLLLRITEKVRSLWPDDKPLFVRISATDWAEGGWTIDESIELSRILKTHGVDVIDCSSGGAVRHQKILVGPGYQVPFAERIRQEANIMTAAVGLITTAEQAQAIVEEEKADVVLIARESLRDPYFPLHAARHLNQDVSWPVQYERAKFKQ